MATVPIGADVRPRHSATLIASLDGQLLLLLPENKPRFMAISGKIVWGRKAAAKEKSRFF